MEELKSRVVLTGVESDFRLSRQTECSSGGRCPNSKLDDPDACAVTYYRTETVGGVGGASTKRRGGKREEEMLVHCGGLMRS